MSPYNKKIRGFPAILLSALAAILPWCISCSIQLAGSGSDTEVSGRIVTPDGNGVPYTKVMFIPTGFNPAFDNPADAGLIDTTDSNGVYQFHVASSGTYNLEAVNLSSEKQLLHNGITVLSNAGKMPIDPDSLKKPVALAIIFSDSMIPLSGSVYVSGTTFYKPKNAGERMVTFSPVPQCTLQQIQFKVSASAPALLLGSNVPIGPADTTFLNPYPGWLHSAKIRINTTASGILVPTIVTDFSAALRLSSANFPFAQARAAGRDLRIADESGKAVPFEVAMWDSSAGQAVLWIGLDTVLPDNAAHFVRMFWGNPGTQSASNAAAVFDTGKGFAGVWHLEENAAGTGTTGLYKDATANGANGDDQVASSPLEGYVGNGCAFANGDGIPTHGRVTDLATGAMTICVWANFSAPGGVVFSKTRSGAARDTGDEEFYFGDSLASGAAGLRPVFSGVGIGSIVAQRDMGVSQWHFYTVKRTLDGSGSATTTFYIDGGLCGTTNTFTAAGPDSSTATLTIGSDGTSYFNGIIDELNISKIARSDDWIMLAFENQRVDQKFLTVEIEK